MNQSETSQTVMNCFDKCNQLLKELIDFGFNSNPFDCCCQNVPPKNIQELVVQKNVNFRNTRDIVDDLSQTILEILHKFNKIEQKAQEEVIDANILIDMMINHNVGDYQQATFYKKQKLEDGKDKEVISELNEQLKKEQALKVEAGQALIKMENQYKSMQRKMEIYFKRRIESIQSQIKNLQSSYINKKEVDFDRIYKRLDKLRRRRPWRDHGLDLLLQEDKKNLQLRFVEGDEDGTSTPFSNYSGILTTDYQLPIDSQLEKDLNQGGYLEDLMFNSSSFNQQTYSMSMASQSHKRQAKTKNKSQNQSILHKFYDEIVLAHKNQLDKDNKIESKQSQNNMLIEKSNIQSNPFLLDQSQRPSTILALQSSYNQEILKEIENEPEIEEEQNSLNISAKEDILLKVYEIEQMTNSYILNEPKNVALEDLFKLIDSVDCNLQKTLHESNKLEDILNDISCSEANKNKEKTKEKQNNRRKSKRRQEIEGLNQVQMVNNSYLKIQQLNLSALLDDDIEPMEEVQKKQKIIDNSKFSQFFVDVSEIKANISQSKPSFSAQNSANTPAHFNYNNMKIDASSISNLGNFNNYIQGNIIQRGNYVPTQEDEILIIDNSSQAVRQTEGSSNKVHINSKGTPVSPNLLINGILNGDLACVSIYDDRTVKNAACQQQQQNLIQNNNENHNNFILPQFDESKISRVFSSANNSFEYNNDSKNNQKRVIQKTKSSKFKDFSKEFLSNSDILNESSFKQEKSLNCISLQQIPDKQLPIDQNENQNSPNQELNSVQFNFEQNDNFLKSEILPQIKKNQQNKIPSPNISFLLGEQINMSEIRKRNNQDDDTQQISAINNEFTNNLQILSRDEKMFNDSKNNLSEFLDQFNSNNDNHKNNINIQYNGANLAITNGETQEEAKKHYINVLDQLSSISDQEFNEQNSLKSPLKETVHVRFDIYDNKQPFNFIDLFNCNNDEIPSEFHLDENQNTISNRKNYEQGELIAINSEQDNEQTTQRQLLSPQISEIKLKSSYSVSPQNKQIPLKRFISVHEKSNTNTNNSEIEKNTVSLQNLFTENNSIIKLLKHQIQADMIAAAGFKKEREAEIQKQQNTPKDTKLTIQKIFSSATSSSSPVQQLKKNNSVPFLEDDNQNLAQYQKKQDSSPLKKMIKNNLYFKNGIYQRPTELNYLHKPADIAKSLQSQSPTFEKKIKQEYQYTPSKITPIKLDNDPDCQNNDAQYSSVKDQNSSSQKQLEYQNQEQKGSLKLIQKQPQSYESSYHQYMRKSFHQSSSETKFSEEKQKILHIIQKKLDIVQTREFNPNIQQLNEYKQSKILMGNPFHRRQRNGFNDQQSTKSFSQRSSIQSLNNIPITSNQSSCQSLAQPNHQELPLNLKEKLLQNYSESVVEAAKRKISNSPSKKILSQMKSYKVKDSPLLHAIQKLKQQSQIEQQN